jgi:hypothetical protein
LAAIQGQGAPGWEGKRGEAAGVAGREMARDDRTTCASGGVHVRRIGIRDGNGELPVGERLLIPVPAGRKFPRPHPR